jgi:hypothetical protein
VALIKYIFLILELAAATGFMLNSLADQKDGAVCIAILGFVIACGLLIDVIRRATMIIDGANIESAEALRAKSVIILNQGVHYETEDHN